MRPWFRLVATDFCARMLRERNAFLVAFVSGVVPSSTNSACPCNCVRVRVCFEWRMLLSASVHRWEIAPSYGQCKKRASPYMSLGQNWIKSHIKQTLNMWDNTFTWLKILVLYFIYSFHWLIMAVLLVKHHFIVVVIYIMGKRKGFSYLNRLACLQGHCYATPKYVIFLDMHFYPLAPA